MIEGYGPITPQLVPTLTEQLLAYADGLVPWATQTSLRMIDRVNRRSRETWRSLGVQISSALKHELDHTPVGDTIRSLLDYQVGLIRSIPIKAAERVQRLTLENLETSARADTIAREIEQSGEVAASRAVLIARTETSRTATMLLQARCIHIGVTEYYWHITNDEDVRKGHRAMAGKLCEWANPPAVIENGRVMHFHAGCIWNCRCWAEPKIPRRFV